MKETFLNALVRYDLFELFVSLLLDTWCCQCGFTMEHEGVKNE